MSSSCFRTCNNTRKGNERLLSTPSWRDSKPTPRDHGAQRALHPGTVHRDHMLPKPFLCKANNTDILLILTT